MKNEVNRAPNIGAKKHKFSNFLTHKGRWFLATLTLLFTFATGQMWGASTTMPTSGSFTNSVTKYELTNSTSVVKNNKIWWATRGSLSVSSDYGMRPYQHGFVVSVTGPVKLTFNVKSNSASARTITGQAYVMTDPLFYVWKNTSVSSSLDAYVQGVNSKAAKDRTEEEAAIAADDKLKTITSSKDANKKMLTCESPEVSLATAHRHAISHNCPTTKGETNLFADTLSAAGNYIIYLTSSGGSVGLTSIEVDPLYPVRTTLTNVTKTSGDTLSGVTNYSAVYAASAGYTLPSTISVTIGGTPAVATNDYTWNAATGTLTVPANKITGVITVEISGETMAGYDATYSSSKGTAPSNESSVSSVTLTQITGVSGWVNTGWTADVATKIGITDKAAGAHLDNGATVTLLENTTFTAEWAQLYTVTYNKASSEGGNVPTQEALLNGETFDVAGQGTLTAPTTGYIFRGWSDGIAANPYEEGDDYTINGANVNFTAVWEAPVTYTISLDANGGTIASYDGWTKDGDVYSKTVTEGTEVSLLAFTKTGLQLMFFRDGSANEYSSSVTLNENLNLKAIWGEEKEVEIYYWEGKSGGATERGGTASPMNGAEAGSDDVNYSQSTYYTLRLRGKADYSTNWIKIELDEGVALKAGDKVKVTAYYSNSSTKQSAPLMKDGDGNTIFAETTTLPNIQNEEDPEERIYTTPAGIDASVLKVTRNVDMTGTNAFVTKLVITGTRVVEEMDPAATPNISAQPASASYTWKQAVQALTVTASVTDGGTLSYQWYKAGETDTKVGSDANSYTPTESGTYYVVVTNKKTGYEDASKTSNNAVVTIGTRPSYTVTYYDGTTSLGTESVLEDANPAAYAAKQAKACHDFVNWKNKADVVIAPASLVVTKDTALYGNWTANYAFGDYSFVNVAEVGTTPNKLTMTDGTTVNVPAGSRVDNIYFSAMAIKYESGASSVLTDYKGWKINTNNATISFLVENDAQVKVGIGQKTDLNVSYTNTESTAQNVSLTQQSEGSYNVKGGTIVTLTMTSNNTTTLKYIKIGDIPAESDDASLSDLKVGGTTITGFSSSKYQYYVELPYGTAHADFPVVTVTTNEEHATAVVNNAKDREDNMTVVHVTAQDGVAEKYYNVYFSVAPKLGVEVFAYTPAGSNGEKAATGYKGGTADINLQTSKTGDGYKLGSNGHYIGITVTDGLKENDLICIDIADLQGATALTFYDGKTDGKSQVITPAPTPKVGKNYVTVPSDMSQIYLYRADGTCNPSVKSVAVYREMPSFFESFTVAGVAATINEAVSPKTITVEVPAVTDITALTPTYKAWANGGATVSPTTAQNFSAGAVEYTVTSAYSEATTYQVTVTKAAAIKEVVISGTLTVQEDATTTLSAVVYDTNDDEAANQNVEWSIPALEAEYATVNDAGVVTALKAGTVHVTATSEADDSKSATVEVVVTENPCRTWNAPSTSWSTAVVTVGKLQIARGDCPASSSVTPYSDASSVYGIKIDGSAKFIELTMSDGAQFESLTLGVASGSNNSSPKYVVVASAAKTFASSAVLSAVEYAANAKDAAQTLNVIDLPTGTRNVRLYRSYEDKGAGTSVFLYYVNACKKEFVPVTAVAVADGNLAIGKSLTLSATTTPVNADIASYVWTIESATATGVTIDGNVLTAAVGATEGEVVVKVVATDVLSNVVQTTATISIVNKFETVKPVTGTTTWDWEPVSVLENGPTISAPDTVLANYISGEIWEMLAGGNGDRPYRGTDNKAFQGKTLYFNTTVPGKLRMYAGRISNDQKVYVNGIEVGKVTSTKGYLNEIVVPAGNVYITAGTNGMRIYNMTFDTNLVPAQAEESFLQGYERTVDPQYYGTICLPKAGVMTGALLFRVSYMDYKEDGVTPYKVYYDQVANGTMEAGMPYIFLAEQSTIGVYYTGTATETAQHHNGLYGTLTDITSGMNAEGRYMIYYNQVLHSTHPASQLPANRAYLQIEEIPGYGNPSYVAPAPKYRRISMGVNAPQIATGMDELNVTDAPRKIMIDGTMYILRGEKMYDATGRLVK